MGLNKQPQLMCKGGVPPFGDHVRNQHTTQWVQYDSIHSNVEREQLFAEIHVVFKNLIKAHFSLLKLWAQRDKPFYIDKDIIRTLVTHITYSPNKDVHNKNEGVEDHHVSRSKVEVKVVLI